MASSLDQIGPIAKTVSDAKIVFDAISGKDPLDSTSVESKARIKKPTNHTHQKSKIKDLVIGVPKEYFTKGIDPKIEKMVKSSIKKYETLGANIEQVSIPYSTEHALAVYYIIMPSEVSANLARYDGIKYGYSATSNLKPTTGLSDVYLRSRREGFGEEVRRRIMLGTYALSAGYYEAYYLKAQKVRTLIRRNFEKVFKKVNVLMAPTSPTLAFKIGEKVVNPLAMYLSDIYMAAVNLVGLPAISIPCGKIENGSTESPHALPVGLQIIGRPFEENKILEIADIFDKIK
jgi:aspartyl-tRNA(Asn)/glutamyl-tRNA(Gln) amidotransferase subunit A